MAAQYPQMWPCLLLQAWSFPHTWCWDRAWPCAAGRFRHCCNNNNCQELREGSLSVLLRIHCIYQTIYTVQVRGEGWPADRQHQVVQGRPGVLPPAPGPGRPGRSRQAVRGQQRTLVFRYSAMFVLSRWRVWRWTLTPPVCRQGAGLGAGLGEGLEAAGSTPSLSHTPSLAPAASTGTVSSTVQASQKCFNL